MKTYAYEYALQCVDCGRGEGTFLRGEAFATIPVRCPGCGGALVERPPTTVTY